MAVLKLLLLLSLHFALGDNCSSATSCSECMSVDVVGKSCYWCAALVTDKSMSGCLRFKTNKIANLLCPSNWVHIRDMCPEEESIDTLDLLKLSNLSPQIGTNKKPNNNIDHNYKYSSHSAVKEDISGDLVQSSIGESKGSDLKDLLHKLLILKLLRKMKNKDTVLTEEEQTLLYKLTHKTVIAIPQPITTTTTTTEANESLSQSHELSEFLKLLREEAERRLRPSITEQEKSERIVDRAQVDDLAKEKIKKELENVDQKMTAEENIEIKKTTDLPKSTKATNLPSPSDNEGTIDLSRSKSRVINSTKMKTIAGHNHVEHVDVKYEENAEETLDNIVIQHKHPRPDTQQTNINTVKTLKTTARTSISTTYATDGTYCKLLEENPLCNSDHNCTWCNTLDTCIHRSKEDYKMCVKHAGQMVDEEYGLDRCFKSKHCKDCVEDDKCYWCEMSQRCHTYPFFGYVPNSCGGDWYVKQCDVQLAVIIVVLPLIIILLGMVTFYFCLKYCHYRQKVLRVPLFEKPGIFDYRKDKKVYFVNPEDESSDDELAKEKMRKKYRLPIEKAPLIDPNT